jgi:hypothetical protein
MMQRWSQVVARSRVALLAGAALLGAGAMPPAPPAPSHALEPPARLARFLRDKIGLDSSQIAAVERGEPVVKVLDTERRLDLAVFGIIAIAAPRQVYVGRLLDFENSLRGGPSRLQFGIFGDPATLADVQTLTLDRRDVADLKTCRAGDCKIKLPGEEMARIRQAIDWSAGDAHGQTDAYVRQRLVEYVTDYRARGDSAMVMYDDRERVRGSEAYAALLAQSPYVFEHIPSLHQYLARYPQEALDGLREVLYWSLDDPKGLRPILRVTHRVVYAPPEIPGLTVMAAKQIFASHYFEAGFDLTAVADRAAATGEPGIYLLLLRRSRFDRFPSIPLINVQARLVSSSGDQMRADLESEKAATERAARR